MMLCDCRDSVTALEGASARPQSPGSVGEDVRMVFLLQRN